VPRTALGPTQHPIQWVPRAPSLGVKRPGRQADHLPPSSAEVKEWVELYLHSPIRFHGVVLRYKKTTGTTMYTLYSRTVILMKEIKFPPFSNSVFQHKYLFF
jgi:hypothetical protein